MGERMSRLCWGMGLVLMLSGCPSLSLSTEHELAGQVLFAGYETAADIREVEEGRSHRNIQATISDVAAAATVSLINPSTNQTRATTLTDSRGRFRLRFANFRPGTTPYYLEAIKGLNSNAVGVDAARVRTIIRWEAGWTSLTSAIPGTDLYISPSTTAISAIVSLRQSTSPVDPLQLIGKIDRTPSGSLPDRFVDLDTGITQTEFTTVRGYVVTALSADRDPFDSVQYDNGTYTLKSGTVGVPPTISYLQPAMASVGEPLTIMGNGFSPTLTGNTVRFNPNVEATVQSATATSIRVIVPNGATTGTLSVNVGGTIATASFTVVPSVNGALNP